MGDGKEGAKERKAVLRTIGKELPDVETDKEFETNWKITRAEEVRHNYSHCLERKASDIGLCCACIVHLLTQNFKNY